MENADDDAEHEQDSPDIDSTFICMTEDDEDEMDIVRCEKGNLKARLSFYHPLLGHCWLWAYYMGVFYGESRGRV